MPSLAVGCPLLKLEKIAGEWFNSTKRALGPSERLQMWQSGTLSSLSHTSLSVQVSNVYVAENRPVKPGDALEEAGRSPRNALTNSN